MTLKEIKLIGISFLSVALLYILNLTYQLGYSLAIISSVIFGLFSVVMVNNALASGRRNILIWNTVIFCTSIVIFISQYNRILDIAPIIIPGLLFCGGLVFLLLFIENNLSKAFLYASASFFVLFTFYFFIRNTLIINKLNLIINQLLAYKTIIIFLLAAFLIWNKQNRN